jgi:phospholipid N-methyltransferase
MAGADFSVRSSRGHWLSAAAVRLGLGQGMTMREFLRSPSGVGSAFPASAALVREALDPVDFSAARLVVEFGPGEGPFTRELLRRMPAGSTLLTIDTSHRFTRYLQESLPDPRLHAVTGSAASLSVILRRLGLGPVDRIVTGIPFSTIAPDLGARILDSSVEALGEQGQIIAYQMRDAVAPLLAARFAEVRTARIWRNMPPCRIYWASGRSG